MTGQAFFVLTALADGPRHGYGIVGEVAELSQGRVQLKIGSLRNLGAEQESGSPAPAHTAPARLTMAALSLASLLVVAGLALFG